MEQPHCRGVELPAESLLALRGEFPGRDRLLFVGDAEDEAAEVRVVGADALLARGIAALELSPC